MHDQRTSTDPSGRKKEMAKTQKPMTLMKPIRKHLKVISAFCMINFLTSLVAPYAANALTSGPTAPEYTSFEPVDTTDMVNLATGDFVYNMPLVEVPGPAGGYPLSLSYHAGIQPGEEASWVGLGWTLNPGAITRTVDGYPDDQLDAHRIRRDYVHGGERNTFSVGVGYGPVTFGLSFSNDTYQGFGVGSSMTLGYSLFQSGKGGVGLGANATVGDDGYGNTFSSIGIGLTVGKANADAGLVGRIGVSTNFQSTSFSGGVSYRDPGANDGKGMSQSLIGASITSKGLKPSMTVGGASASQHNSKANKWTTKGSGFSVPIPIGPVMLNLGYRYLRYYIDETSDVYVIGSLHSDQTFGKDYDDHSFDSYSLIEIEEDFETQDPEKSRGGSFPAFDHYGVTAQGLSGSIRPYTFGVGSLMRQNLKTEDQTAYEIKYEVVGQEMPKSHFRFVNDFSNSLTFDERARLTTDTHFTQFGSPLPGEAAGYNTPRRKLAGSKHIEHYTNRQIRDSVAFNEGFIDYQSIPRSLTAHGDVRDQIGGYMITNESGVTFYYALPVYAYDEYSRNQKKEDPEGVFTEYTQKAPYAYTWLLTAITGPDFVDRGGTANAPNGVLDQADWGYWVRFDYGKWADNYQWRNPAVGYHSDLNADYEQFSEGKKELYYLDAISTKSHVALFEKEIRADAKSLIPDRSTFGVISQAEEHGCYQDPFDGYWECEHEFTSYDYSRSTLRLKNVYLLDSPGDDFVANLRASSSEYDHVFVWPSEADPISTESVHMGLNVIDTHDFSSSLGSSILNKSLRVVSLDHSYELQDGPGDQGVVNSFNESGDMYRSPPTSPNIATKLGKLTLKSVDLKGKKGIPVVPPTRFAYAKNPSYNEDNYDIWGLYKSDYQDLGDENISRFVTDKSALDVDAWSLSKISTSLGADIDVTYESDSYRRPVLYKNSIATVKSIDPVGPSKSRIYVHNTDILKQYELHQNIEVLTYHSFYYEKTIANFCACDRTETTDYKVHRIPVTISSIGNDYLEVDSQELAEIKQDHPPSTSNLEYDPTAECRCAGGRSDTYEDGVFLAANVSSINNINQKGGGLRVKQIAVSSPEGINATNYSYLNPEDQVTSGTTSFEPFGMNRANFNGNDVPEDKQKKYQKELNEEFSGLLLISREVQAPGVIYEYVTVEEEVDGVPVPGKQVFNFQVFEKGFVERTPISSEDEEIVETCDCDVIASACAGSGDFDGGPCFDKNCNELELMCQDDPDGIIENYMTKSHVKPIMIKDYTTRVGNLKSVKTYGEDDLLLAESRTEYQYERGIETKMEDGEEVIDWGLTNQNFRNKLRDKFKNQGAIQQMFAERRKVKKDGLIKTLNVLSKKEEYPSIVVKTTDINHKTGITTFNQNLAFDYYTGDVAAVYTEDGYGNKYLSKSVPAYRYYHEMGLKLHDLSNKHMLSQSAASYSYLMSSSFNPDVYTYETDAKSVAIGLVGASVQTWSKEKNVVDGFVRYDNQATDKIYRMDESYSYIGLGEPLNDGGTYPVSNFSELTLAAPIAVSEATGWQQNAKVRLYDVYSHALEASDVNGNLAATRFDAKNERVLATIANASYDEFFYAGFEKSPDDLSGSPIQLQAGTIDEGEGTGHTGRKAVRLANSGGTAFTYQVSGAKLNGNTYVAKVWKKASVSTSEGSMYVSGGGATLTQETLGSANGWELIQATISIPTTTSVIEIGCQSGSLGSSGASLWFDDFRFQPQTSSMSSYVYNKWGELSHILDANNLYTYYGYDEMGRLDTVARETLGYGKVLTSFADIHYGSGVANNMSGAIQTSYKTNGDLQMEFVFARPGSGNYSYEWRMNGSLIGTSSKPIYDVIQQGGHHVTVQVTDLTTGQKVTRHKLEDLQQCPVAGTVLNSICLENERGCKSGFVTKWIANGDCTMRYETVYDGTMCNNLDENGADLCASIFE